MSQSFYVEGDGPLHPLVAYAGEAPAKEEVKQGRALVGPSGKITWAFTTLTSGLRREQIYVTNLKKEPFTLLEEKKGMLPGDFDAWCAVMDGELAERNPAYVLALGKYSTACALGKRPADISMEVLHGIPHRTEKGYIVMPAFHPAAGMRDSKRMAYTYDDFVAFAQLLEGKLPPWEPKVGGRDYRLAEFGLDTRDRPWEIVAIDTEYDGDEPIMLTYSTEPGMGRAILADNAVALKWFADRLRRDRPLVIFHNALADLAPLRRMGIDVVGMGLDFRDTMVLAWYQETVRQGLKPLAYRFLGVDRSDFETLVSPYFAAQMVHYLNAVVEVTRPPDIITIGKKGKPLKPKPGKASRIHKLAKGYVRDHEKGKIKDYLKRWENWDEDVRNEMVSIVGKEPTFSLKGVPLDVAVPYAASDTDDTLSLLPKLKPYNEELSRMDHRKIPMIDAMQSRGLRVDLERQEPLLKEVVELLDEKREFMRILLDKPAFNPNSADEIAEILYGFKKIAPGVGQFMKDREYILPPNFTKAGKPKTDKKALGTIRDQHVLPGLLLEYKELEKLKNTYIEPLPRYVKYEDGLWILHPNFTHTRVPSGRLASSRPNIMAIPSRTEMGLRVRSIFRPRPGFKFVSFDYSQIEIVLAAAISGDPVLSQILREGADMHIVTAADITGKASRTDTAFWKKDPVGKVLRQVFKKINYTMLYGGTAERIYLELLAEGIQTFALEQVSEFRTQWFKLYSGIVKTIVETEQFIQAHGYAEDMWGRRRKLPGGFLYGRFWPMSALREEAVRQGFSLLIQGGAQGLLIRAMIGFWEEELPIMREERIQVHPLLQIHDELMFEIEDKRESIEFFRMMGLARMLADQELFDVPIESSFAEADDWGGLK